MENVTKSENYCNIIDCYQIATVACPPLAK
jgi:hypothetical protein